MIFIVALILIAIFAVPIAKLVKEIDSRRFKPYKYKNPVQLPVTQTYSQENSINYAKSYQRKYLLTKFEYMEYQKLKEAAKARNYMICPKVRLLDLVEPYSNSPHYKTLLYKIQSKHVDFVITDDNLNVKVIIELDDNSHYTPERIERDKFVDTVLRSTGYTTIHVKSINTDIFDIIDKTQRKEEYKEIIEQIKTP